MSAVLLTLAAVMGRPWTRSHTHRLVGERWGAVVSPAACGGSDRACAEAPGDAGGGEPACGASGRWTPLWRQLGATEDCIQEQTCWSDPPSEGNSRCCFQDVGKPPDAIG